MLVRGAIHSSVIYAQSLIESCAFRSTGRMRTGAGGVGRRPAMFTNVVVLFVFRRWVLLLGCASGLRVGDAGLAAFVAGLSWRLGYVGQLQADDGPGQVFAHVFGQRDLQRFLGLFRHVAQILVVQVGQQHFLQAAAI